MTSKTIAIAAVVATACVLLCNGFAQQPARIPNAVEEPQKQPQLLPANLGRYQITALDNSSTIAVIDTHTGHCWTRAASTTTGSWRDLGSPVKAKDADMLRIQPLPVPAQPDREP